MSIEVLSTDEILEIIQYLPAAEIYKLINIKMFHNHTTNNQFWKIFFQNTIKHKIEKLTKEFEDRTPNSATKLKKYQKNLNNYNSFLSDETSSSCWKTTLWKFHQKETIKNLNHILKYFSLKYPYPQLGDWKNLFEKINKLKHQTVTKNHIKCYENEHFCNLFNFFTMGLSHGFTYPTGYFLFFSNQNFLKNFNKNDIEFIYNLLKDFMSFYQISILKSNFDGTNPFYWIIKTNDFDFIKLSVKYALKDDMNQLNKEIKNLGTPVEFSIKNGSSIKIIEFLLNSGIEYQFKNVLNLKPNYLKYSLTMSNLDVVRYLIENSKQFNTKINKVNLRTVFSSDYRVWALDNRIIVLKYLIEHNGIQIPTGFGILSIAFRSFTYHKNSKILLETVKYLVEKGADIQEVYQGKTPLHEATQLQDVNLVSFLLSKGANRNVQDLVGKIPEDYAIGFKLKFEFYKSSFSSMLKFQ
eukprot:gene6970-11136_t